MGKGGQKGKGKERERLQRDDRLEQRYNAPPAATSHNVNAFLFCLSLYLRKIIAPMQELSGLDCFWKFSKFLTFVFRHNSQLLHEDLSFTLNELFWFDQFTGHINAGLSYIQRPAYANNPYFGKIDCDEVRSECKKSQIPYESMRYFAPFVCGVWFNDKGRLSLSVQHDTPIRLPQSTEWRTPPCDADEMLEYIRHNGSIKGTNIFFRAQSGHSRIRQSQRLGVDYDFRHNILIHKTTFHKFKSIKHCDCRALKVMDGRDIHLVPIEFLYHDPEMLRQYGDRIILFNMNCPETRDALRSAKETPNGYILVNEDISVDHFEAVYALEKQTGSFLFRRRHNPGLLCHMESMLPKIFALITANVIISKIVSLLNNLNNVYRTR